MCEVIGNTLIWVQALSEPWDFARKIVLACGQLTSIKRLSGDDWEAVTRPWGYSRFIESA